MGAEGNMSFDKPAVDHRANRDDRRLSSLLPASRGLFSDGGNASPRRRELACRGAFPSDGSRRSLSGASACSILRTPTRQFVAAGRQRCADAGAGKSDESVELER
jgi:hypothetical protein